MGALGKLLAALGGVFVVLGILGALNIGNFYVYYGPDDACAARGSR